MARPLAASFQDRRGQNSTELGTALNDGIWGLPPGASSTFYLEHYNALSSTINTTTLSFVTHDDVIDLVNLIKNGRDRPLRDLRADIGGTNRPWLANNSAATVQSAIDFAVSLWLMVQTRSWNDDDSLCDFVHSLFRANAAANPADDELSFNARSLWAIGGIDLAWTSRLSEHLRLNKRTSELYVFRYASLLGRRVNTGQDQIYPIGLLRETAETIALLFPLAETSHKNWNRRVRKKADVDVETGIAANTPRNLDHYSYWRDRLELVQSTYDKTAPNKLRQWLHDRRDSNRFYTFWFAVIAICLTLLFGLIQSVTGLYGVIKPAMSTPDQPSG